MLAKSKQFLFLIRHVLCSSYGNGTDIEERTKNLHKRGKIHCHLRNG